MDINSLNKYCLERVGQYQNLQVFGKEVFTPYFINKYELEMLRLMKESGISKDLIMKTHQKYKDREISFGWYRGKGSPEEITSSLMELNDQHGLGLEYADRGTILDVMRFYGLGVDCSGFAYHVLQYGLDKVGKSELLNNTLVWANPENSEQSVYHAGAFTFAGCASDLINPQKVRELDLVLKKNNEGKYSHVALVLAKGGSLFIAQSSFRVSPQGVSLTELSIQNGKVVFGFKPSLGEPWEELLNIGRLEFRRLKFLIGTAR